MIRHAIAILASVVSGVVMAADGSPETRIVLTPQVGAMQVTARVPRLNDASFALGIPETIGCREALLVNFPEARIEWEGPDSAGAVSCSWGPGGRISYALRLVPAEDFVDVEMTVRNHTEFLWRDVFAFNCVNPIQAPAFQDWKLRGPSCSRKANLVAWLRQRACKETCRRSSFICRTMLPMERNRYLCEGLARRVPTAPMVPGS